MDYSPILAPVVALVAWTIIIMLWMVVARFSEFRRLGITLDNIPAGARGADLEGRADARAQWKSHNYTHLVEQPTLFYAMALVLALMDMGGGINLYLAWGYVAFRAVHSLIQATVNIVKWRLLFFVLATLCLLGMTVHAGMRILHDCGILAF